MDHFQQAVREWFSSAMGAPSLPQAMAWPHIAAGESVLLHAPTGSGKTLAAFMSAIDRLFRETVPGSRTTGVDTLYISPLKALNNDIERNLRDPLDGIRNVAASHGEELPEIRAEVRTGDTPPSARARMVRTPPHILITTPESLYLVLTSPRARDILRTVKTVIVDEIHSVSGTKRGVHLSLSLERLERLSPGFQRIGLSATQKPLEEVARFLGGQAVRRKVADSETSPRPVTIVDARFEKRLEVQVVGMPDREIGEDAGSIWPKVIPSVLRDIRDNRTTLVFANSRRQAEQAAERLNTRLQEEEEEEIGSDTDPMADLVADEVSLEPGGPFYAHHGSISNETRHLLEEALKAGELSALVGTSSLELGIDIGTVDLVVQLQSPKSVTQGLQRVGRSGHRVGETSRYRIYATHEDDLLEAAVVARGMADGDVEEVYTPRNALDVLSQQVVAAVAVDDWNVEELFRLVRGSYPFESLARDSFDAVLKLVSGRYPRHVFSTLRPRVNWDEANGILRALPGTRMHAVDNGGAIVDRGAFPVYLPDRKTRIGELDEEFVYESKPGDAFVLGSQVWRASDIDDDRVIVEPAPGAAPRMPFWRGEFPWRTVQLSGRLARFKTELAARLEPFVEEETDPPVVMRWLMETYFCDEAAARQLVNYVRRQLRSTREVASDRTLMVEAYDDAVGDRRLVVHSPFGGKINGPWSVALTALIRERTGVEPEVEVNDDGMLFRLSGADEPFPDDLLTALTVDETRERVLAGLADSALFGALFRQNAQRALLLPGARRGRRTPFWLQRLRSKDLLAVSRSYPDFPVMLETFRDCLEDAMDLAGLLSIVEDVRSGRIMVSSHSLATPSPVARALSFALESWYMYQWDAPKAERAVQALGLDRHQLASLMRDPEFAGTLRDEAISEVEVQASHTVAGRRARSETELAQLIEDLGELTAEEIALRCDGDAAAWIARLEAESRAVRVMLHHGEAWSSPSQAEEYSAVTGIGTGAGPSDREALRNVLRRFAGRSATVTQQDMIDRYGVPEQLLVEELEVMSAAGELVWGYFTAGEREWAASRNLEGIQARTLSILRSEIRPVSPLRYQQELLRLHRISPATALSGLDALRKALELMRGVALSPGEWVGRVLPARVGGFTVGLLDRVLKDGSVNAVALPPDVPGHSTVCFVPKGRGRELLAEAVVGGLEVAERSFGPVAERVLQFISSEGRVTSEDLRAAFRDLRLGEITGALSDLAGSGLVTCDSWTGLVAAISGVHAPPAEDGQNESVPARAGGARGRVLARRQATRRMRELTTGLPTDASWFRTNRFSVLGGESDPATVAESRALALLERHGVVSRRSLQQENNDWSWREIVDVLSLMELRGRVRRGYFVPGLPGIQFALPETVELLRSEQAPGTDDYAVISAGDFSYVLDPALLEAADEDTGLLSGLTRIASNHVVFRGDEPILRSELNGGRVRTAEIASVDELQLAVRSLRDHLVPSTGSYGNRMSVAAWNGERVLGSAGEELLAGAGFRRDYPEMTFDAVQARAMSGV